MDYFDILLAKKLSGGGGGEIEVESLTATENGTYNAGTGKAYNPVVVAVPEPTLITKSISQNGTYNASDDNADGYSSVTVDVEGYQIKNIPNVPADIASFTDGTDLPMPKLEVGIEAVQSGSGDPSPQNVRPISGWTGVEIERTSKNLFDNTSISISDITFNSTNGEITRNGFFYNLPAGTYTISMSGTFYNYIYLNVLQSDGTFVSRNVISGSDSPYADKTFTLNKGDYIAIYKATSGQLLTLPDKVQIENGLEATTYESYNGTTYPISWQTEAGTVYGGELDVKRGVLKSSYKLMNAKDMTWTLYAPTNACYSNRADTDNSITEEYPNGKRPIWCTIATYKASGAMMDNECQWGGITNNKNLNIKNSYTTTLEDWQNYINENDVYIAYAIEPITVQLTPTQITTLLGNNNIWADSGQIISGQYFAEL